MAPRSLQRAAVQLAKPVAARVQLPFVGMGARFESSAAKASNKDAEDQADLVKEHIESVPKYNPPVKTGMKGISIVRY